MNTSTSCIQCFCRYSNLHILNRNRIHEHTILLRFLDIILRVIRLEVSVDNVCITNQFQTTFAQGWEGGVKFVTRGDCE
jgi:hypothetical protein